MFARAVHPGLILKEELAKLSLTLTEFARKIDVRSSASQVWREAA